MEASTDLQSLHPTLVSTGESVLDHRLGLPTELGNHQLQVGRSWLAIVETGARVFASVRGSADTMPHTHDVALNQSWCINDSWFVLWPL